MDDLIKDNTIYNCLSKDDLKKTCVLKSLNCIGTKSELICRITGKPVQIKECKESKDELDENPVEDISSLKVAQLKDICKSVGFRTTGKRADLINRVKRSSVLRMIEKNRETISLTHLEHNLYIHAPTGFVFDKDTKKVCERLVDNVRTPLSKQDVELCMEMGFNFTFPLTFKM
jgi:hypothetical protein